MISRSSKQIGLIVILVGVLAACGGGTSTEPPPTSPITSTAPPPGTAVLPTATTPPTPAATPEGPQATVVDTVNEVDAHPVAAGEWQDAQAGMGIYVGGQVWAQEASTARLQAGDGLVRVAPNSIFTFGHPEPDTLQFNLQEGQLWLDVEGLEEGESIEVETPGAVTSVRGTRFSVRTTPDGGAIISSQVGTVTVAAETGVVSVTPGLQTTVPAGERPGHPVPISFEEQALWGMAAGPHLGVVLPAFSMTTMFSYTGYSSYWGWSPGGEYFVIIYYDTSREGYLNYFCAISATMPVTDFLPFEAGGFSFNPAGEGYVYLQYDRATFQTDICVADAIDAPPQCWGEGYYHDRPYWSPDGEWLLFSSNRTVPENLFKSRPDGSELIQLTFETTGTNSEKSWSPDGDRIAYVRAPSTSWGPSQLWTMEADGSNPQMIFAEPLWGGTHPAWSPDGSWIAVTGFDTGVWLVRPDGSEAYLVPGSESRDCQDPVWSLTDDGWPLFYTGIAEENRPELWYAPQEGAEAIFFSYGWGPIWAADGSRVALGLTDYSGRDTDNEIYLFHSEASFWR
ncbi:MAG: PD40 domain-containing protein [Anaerolineae bacterium]|nr:PD40 domain-containing protein [Anaerolineae bacterium]